MRIYVFFLTLLLFSCGNTARIKKDFIKLNSSPIVIPIDMKIIYNGKDTLVKDFSNCKLKFIVYVDSLGCTSCNINKMNSWNHLLQYAEKVENRLKFYFSS